MTRETINTAILRGRYPVIIHIDTLSDGRRIISSDCPATTRIYWAAKRAGVPPASSRLLSRLWSEGAALYAAIADGSFQGRADNV
jgi:hypothetical protein